MNHDKLPAANTPESRANDEKLTALHARIGAFVRDFGPGDAALAAAIADEASSSSLAVYLNFPRAFLEEIAPEPTQRLEIEELSLFQDVHMDDITSALGNGVYIDKSPDARFESTIYNKHADATFGRESEPRAGDRWPLPSEDPSRASNQECDDINAILDALLQLDREVVTSIVQTEIA